MKSRVLVAAVGIPVLLVVVLCAPLFVMALALAALAGIGGLELCACVSGGRAELAAAVLPALTVLFSALCAGVLPVTADPALLSVWFLLMVVAVCAYGVYRAGAVKFDQMAAYLSAGIFIAWSFAAFLRMAGRGVGRAFLLLPFILSFACDTAAFFVGRSFGTRKLAPVVSPHKTVEGALGGLAGSVLGGLLFTFVVRHTGGSGIGYGRPLLLSLLCGVAAQIGDLSFSLIKREYGIKDYGRLFLEHGGVLDRFDSVLFVTPLAEVILSLLP